MIFSDIKALFSSLKSKRKLLEPILQAGLHGNDMQQKTPPFDGEDEDSSESDEETEEDEEDTVGLVSEAIGADHEEEEESEDYVKFLEATEKHRRARDKDVKVDMSIIL